MGVELAKAMVRIRGDASGLRKDLVSTRRNTDSFLSGLQASVMSTATQIAGAATGIMAGVTAAAKGFLQSGLMKAGQFEQTNIAFETMLGSVSETKKTLSDLTTFAAKTPFEMPEILQAARGLIQFGERGDEMKETLNILGNAAAGTSQPFGMLALIFNQVRGVGKLLTQDFRQLSTRGVISLQDIADHFGVTTGAAQKMLSAGKVTFSEFRKILKKQTEEGGRFFNLMERQSTSLLGLISTLKDAWGIMTRVLASSVVPAAKMVVSWFIKIVDGIQQFVIDSNGAAGAAIAGATAFGVLGTAIGGVITATKLLGVTWKAVMIGSGVGIAVLAIGAAVGFLINKHKELIAEVGKSKLAEIWDGLKSAALFALPVILGVWEEIRAIAVAVPGVITNAWNSFFGWIDGMWPGLKTVAADAWESSVGFVRQFVSGALGFLTNLRENLSSMWNWIRDNWRNLFKDLGKVFMGFVRSLPRNLLVMIETQQRMWAAFTGWLAGRIKKLFTFEFLDAVLTGLIKVGEKVREWGLAIWETIKNAFTGGGSGALDEFMKTVSNDFQEGMKDGDLIGNMQRILNEQANKLKNPLEGIKFDTARLPELNLKVNGVDLEKYAFNRGKDAAKQLEEGLGGGGKKKSAQAAADKPLLGAGRTGIAQLGRSLQDKLLKQEKNDLQKQANVRLGDLVKGQEIQTKILKEQKPAAQLT